MVTLDQFRCVRHGITDVGKPFAADTIEGKLSDTCRSQVEAGQIADGVIVGGVAKTTQRHRPGVTRTGSGLGIQCYGGLGQHALSLRVTGLRRFPRWRIRQTQAI